MGMEPIYIYIYIYIYSRSSVTQNADNSTLPITQYPKNIWLYSYLLHVNKNPITKDFAKQRYNTPYACNVI